MTMATISVRENLDKIRKVHTGHSYAMARADLMAIPDPALERLSASLARLGGKWEAIAGAEIARREALSR
jgi:hypothetical protein